MGQHCDSSVVSGLGVTRRGKSSSSGSFREVNGRALWRWSMEHLQVNLHMGGHMVKEPRLQGLTFCGDLSMRRGRSYSKLVLAPTHMWSNEVQQDSRNKMVGIIHCIQGRMNNTVGTILLCTRQFHKPLIS